mmetsp:Transcript_97284/g.222912  ORF Transcript_97284/g.222912 Transcript_97284/m.222912 type:complete len:169 (-) Transcript_97284:76-582(-)
MKALNGRGGLCFFNRGPASGFSQPHKHVQVVPLPVAPTCETIPLERQLLTTQPLSGRLETAALPYKHVFFRRGGGAQDLRSGLEEALQFLGLEEVDPSKSWNLLWTSEWLIVIPRSQETFAGLSPNAVAYTGALFVKSDSDAQKLREVTPTGVLVGAGFPSEPRKSNG